MRRLRLLSTAAATLLAWSSLLGAAEPQQVKSVKDVVFKLYLDHTSVPLSGRLRLTLTATGPAGLEIDPVTSVVASKDWEVSPEKALAETRQRRAHWSQTFELEPLSFDKDKKLPLPVAPLHYRVGSGDWQEQSWDPIDITVTASVTAANLEDAKGITGIETLPPVPGWMAWQIGGLAGLVVLAGIGLAVWRWKRAPLPAVPEPPPHEWALRELERIDALDLPGGQEVERYHTLLSNVLRRYLELRFGLHAPEQTTPEFLAGLQKSAVLPVAQQGQLQHFLEHCDLAKFARAEFSVSECRAVAALARELIDVTAKKPADAMAERNGQPAAAR